MRVGSLFSGVGGFDLGFEAAGHEIVWQVEFDEDCQTVLRRRFPHASVKSDINAYAYGRAKNRQKHGLILPPVDIVVGGFPCQDVSIAGQRKGLAGSRSGLFFAFMRILSVLNPRPQMVVIENVPGLLTSHGGRDFHTVLAALAERGFRRGYRILDSQYFGLAQRRKRVFIVGCARASGLDPAEILFESAGRAGDLAPSRSTGPRVAASLRGRASRAGVNELGRGGEDDQNLICFDWQSGGDVRHNVSSSSSSSSSSSLQTNQTPAVLVGDQVTYALGSHAGTADGVQTNRSHAKGGPVGMNISKEKAFSIRSGRTQNIAATLNAGGNDGGFRTEPGEHLVLTTERARALTGTMFKRHDEDTDTLIPVRDPWLDVPAPSPEDLGTPIASPITASAGHHGHSSPRGDGRDNLIPFEQEVAFALRRDPGGIGQAHNATFPNGVRRLTPLECERLQGFPDGWTCLCGNGHRGSIYCTCPDTPRYKQMGNAVSVPVAQWIAERIPVRIAKVGIA